MDSITCDLRFTTENRKDVGDTKVGRCQFYKPISSSLGILKTSALSETIKSATATQEIIRRLSNTRK